MVRPAADAFAAASTITGAGALVLLLWAAFRIRRQHQKQQNTTSEASLPAAAVSPRELRRRLRRYGNTFPEADVPSYPLLGHALNLPKVHKIAKRVGSVFNMHVFVIEALIATGYVSCRVVVRNAFYA
ncbi:hypothetical protein HK405_012926 [Cladochytrium tenue]|nr:hypothetical protein HK405_012926 [Cladochytrium tenue]